MYDAIRVTTRSGSTREMGYGPTNMSIVLSSLHDKDGDIVSYELRGRDYFADEDKALTAPSDVEETLAAEGGFFARASAMLRASLMCQV